MLIMCHYIIYKILYVEYIIYICIYIRMYQPPSENLDTEEITQQTRANH